MLLGKRETGSDLTAMWTTYLKEARLESGRPIRILLQQFMGEVTEAGAR